MWVWQGEYVFSVLSLTKSLANCANKIRFAVFLDGKNACGSECHTPSSTTTTTYNRLKHSTTYLAHEIFPSGRIWRACERVYVCVSMCICHSYLHGSFEFSTLKLCCCLLFWFVLWLCVPLLMNTVDKEKHSTQLIVTSLICLTNVWNIHHSTSLFKVTPNDMNTLVPVCMCVLFNRTI